MDKKEDFRRKERSFMTYFIRRPKVGVAITLMIFIMGLFTAFIIPKENFPNISFGVISISTVYPGASAVDVDQLITRKIESELKSIDGVSSMRSTSRNSLSSIVLEFEPDVDIDKALADIRSEIDAVKPSLPSEVDNGPNIFEQDTSLTPILFLYLSGEYSDLELTEFAEDLQEHLEDVPNVAQVSLSNSVEKEIAVEIDPIALEGYGLTVQDVTSKISSSNRDIPLGDLEIDDLNYSMRFAGKHESVEDIRNIRLRDIGTEGELTIVYLEDVAEIYERGKENSSIERIFAPQEQYVGNAVGLTISKDDGTNIFNVADSVREQSREFAEENFPSDVELVFSRQADQEVKRSYTLLLNSMISAVTVVMLLIFILVGFKEGLIAGMVIPLAFLSTIAVLYFQGSSLNFMTNFSMVLALGILVDTAIVIVEGAHDFVKKGETPYRAAILALHEFRQPLISGTLTTLAVFVPLFSLPGTLGKFLTFIPITVFIVLTASLFISLFLITLYTAQFLKPEDHEKKRGFISRAMYKTRQVFNKMQSGVIGVYGALVRGLLKFRVIRLLSLVVLTVTFVASFLIPVKFELFPQGDANFFQISVSKPTGTVKESVSEYVKPLEKEIIALPEVKLLNTSVSGNSASMLVELLAKEDRELKQMRTSKELVELLDGKFKEFDGAEIRVRNAESGPPSEAPVVIRVVAAGSDRIEAAEEVARDFKDILAEIEGTSGISDNIDKIPGEINFKIDREKAIAYGLDPDLVFGQVRTMLQGITATIITEGKKDIDVRVEFSEEDVDTIDEIRNLTILSRSGEHISLGEITEFDINPALSSVQRVDRDIVFTVSSLLSAEGNAQEITNEFLSRVENYEMPQGVSFETAGENEENAELLQALSIAFVIAMFIMFLILLIQFGSYVQPFIILSTIIFANIGVNAGLWLTGTDRGLPVILGFIALAGVVVNDAIILIDQINRKRREKNVSRGIESDELNEGIDVQCNLSKRELVDVISSAGETRFNPILLTTLTTIAGIMPLVYVDEFWRGLSFTVIFGLMVASGLTLFITPVIYYQLEREKLVTFLPVILLIVVAAAGALLSGAIPGVDPNVGIYAGIGMVVLAVVVLLFTVRAFRKAGARDRTEMGL